jgi:hypothetical protein
MTVEEARKELDAAVSERLAAIDGARVPALIRAYSDAREALVAAAREEGARPYREALGLFADPANWLDDGWTWNPPPKVAQPGPEYAREALGATL